MPETKRPLKVFLFHIIPLWDGVTVCACVSQGDDMRELPAETSLTKDGVDAWLDKEKPCGEQRRTILPGQDWELEIRTAV